MAVKSLVKEFETKSPECRRRCSTKEVENHFQQAQLVCAIEEGLVQDSGVSKSILGIHSKFLDGD